MKKEKIVDNEKKSLPRQYLPGERDDKISIQPISYEERRKMRFNIKEDQFQKVEK